ncbi:unnamed protein product [Auanema sp. JU1783]|nr:unnamed protein product [Auanema sp. JU1783]
MVVPTCVLDNWQDLRVLGIYIVFVGCFPSLIVSLYQIYWVHISETNLEEECEMEHLENGTEFAVIKSKYSKVRTPRVKKMEKLRGRSFIVKKLKKNPTGLLKKKRKLSV